MQQYDSAQLLAALSFGPFEKMVSKRRRALRGLPRQHVRAEKIRDVKAADLAVAWLCSNTTRRSYSRPCPLAHSRKWSRSGDGPCVVCHGSTSERKKFATLKPLI